MVEVLGSGGEEGEGGLRGRVEVESCFCMASATTARAIRNLVVEWRARGNRHVACLGLLVVGGEVEETEQAQNRQSHTAGLAAAAASSG